MNPDSPFNFSNPSEVHFYVSTEDPAALKRTISELTETLRRVEGERDHLQQKSDTQKGVIENFQAQQRSQPSTPNYKEWYNESQKRVMELARDLDSISRALRNHLGATTQQSYPYAESDNSLTFIESVGKELKDLKDLRAKVIVQSLSNDMLEASARITIGNLINDGSLSPSYKELTPSGVIRSLVGDRDASRASRDFLQKTIDEATKLVNESCSLSGYPLLGGIRYLIDNRDKLRVQRDDCGEAVSAYAVLKRLAQQYDYDYDGDTRSLIKHIVRKVTKSEQDEAAKLRNELAHLQGKLVNIRINFGLGYEPRENALDLAERIVSESDQVKSDLVEHVKRLAEIEPKIESLTTENAGLRKAIDRYDSRVTNTITTMEYWAKRPGGYPTWGLELDLTSVRQELEEARNIVNECTSSLTN